MPLDLADPSARRTWLEAMRAKVLDLVAVAEDATRRRAERFFAKAEQRRRVAELEGALLGLLDEAAGSLRPLALARAPGPEATSSSRDKPTEPPPPPSAPRSAG